MGCNEGVFFWACTAGTVSMTLRRSDNAHTYKHSNIANYHDEQASSRG